MGLTVELAVRVVRPPLGELYKFEPNIISSVLACSHERDALEGRESDVERRLFSVEIKVVTWAKDSHGLFDYESKTLDYKRFTLDNTTKFFRNPSSNLKCDAASEVEIRTCEESKSQKHPLADLELQPLAEIVRKESTAAEGSSRN